MKYIFDTYTWIEILKGSSEGNKANLLIKDNDDIITSDATFAEIYSWAKHCDAIPGDMIQLIRERSQIFPIYTNIWVEAANHKENMRKEKKDFGQIDALLLAIQDATGATIVTGDLHFKGLKNVILL